MVVLNVGVAFMMFKKIFLLTLSFLLIDSVMAHRTEQTLEINAAVVDSCVISANNLNFGKFDLDGDIAGTTISVKCTAGTPYAIGLSKSTSSGNPFNGRQMKNKSSSLNYNLYHDPGKKQVWGDSINDMLVGDGNGENQLYTIYGQILPGQDVPTGNYSDIIHLTLSWGSSNPAQASKQGILNYQISLRVKILAQKLTPSS